MKPLKPTKEQLTADSKHLAAVQMCIYGALKVVFECCKDGTEILNKYNTKNHQLKTLLKNIGNFASNSSDGLAKLADKQGDVARQKITVLSAGNFLALYFAAMKVMPDQLDAYCAEMEEVAEKYFQDSNKTFEFWEWAESEGFKAGANSRFYKTDSKYFIMKKEVDGNECLHIVKVWSEITTPTYSGAYPTSELEATQLFNIIEKQLF